MSKLPSSFDIVISGGGSVGLTLALALMQNTDCNIALIEQYELNVSTSGQDCHKDVKSVALSHVSLGFLSSLGLTELGQSGGEIQHIHVSDHGHLGQSTISHNEFNIDKLGHVVELNGLISSLNEKLTPYIGERLTIFERASIQNISLEEQTASIQLQSQQVLTTSLFVVAEGSQSASRTLLQQQVSDISYGQSAVVANVRVEGSKNGWAYERFTQHGPIGLLPLSQQNNESWYSLVWSQATADVQDALSLSKCAFLEQLQNVFGFRSGRFVDVGTRQSFPLHLVSAKNIIGHRHVLIGNAAQSLHPIAGQGLNLALRDVKSLVDTVVSVCTEKDIGSYEMLRDYANNRHPDRQEIISATDALVRVFSNQYLPTVVSRNIALSLLGMCDLSKGAFAARAMGIRTSNSL